MEMPSAGCMPSQCFAIDWLACFFGSHGVPTLLCMYGMHVYVWLPEEEGA